MPKKLEKELKKEGKEKGFTGERLDRYVYGGMRNIGWRPEREKHSKKK